VQLRSHLVGDAEASGLFQHCAAVVLPYTQASQSALIAAAYYYQKPVIASCSGALPEYVETGETGWLMDPTDESALADALAEALDSSQRLRRMGTAGRRWYEQQRERELPSLQSMYAQVVGGASAASAHSASHIELG
jgi:glycosyltransferase involved in cell wall biosynthesis